MVEIWKILDDKRSAASDMMDKLKLQAQAEKSNVMEGIFRQANQRNDFHKKRFF